MKSFGNILFIIVLFALGYAIYPSLSEHLGWGGADEATETDTTDLATTADPDDAEPAPNERPAPPAPNSDNATQPEPPNDSASALATRFPYPNIRSLEDITRNWTAVPTRALPKQVTLYEELKFTLGAAGSVTKPADSEVYVSGTNATGQVKVTMAPGSNNEALVPMANTDFKKRVKAMYDEGVANIHARIDAQREAEVARLAAADSITAEEKASVGGSTNTARAKDDYLGLMKDSVASGELTGLSTTDITDWRSLGFEKVGGDTFWTGAAIYMVETLFGEFQTEAKAYIREGRVVRWERVDN